MRRDDNGRAKIFNCSFLSDLLSRIKEIKVKNKEKDLKITVVQIMSAVMLPALMPKLFRSFAKINFEDAGTREAYVANLLDHFFE